MTMRHEHQEQIVHEPVVTEETTVRASLGPAQVVSFAIGVANVVFGGVGVARTGVRDLTGGSATVAGMEMTGLLALIHLVIGLIALTGAASRPGATSATATVGAVFIAGGIIALIQRVEALAWTEANGVAYVVMGGVAILAGLATREGAVMQRRVSHGH